MPALRSRVPQTATLRVAIADEHAAIRQGVRRLMQADPGLRLLVEAAEGEALVAALQLRPVDVVLMDLDLPDTDGFGLIRRVRAACPGAAILVLTMRADPQFVSRALEAGARGYVTKDQAGVDLVKAIRRLAAGEVYVAVPQA